MILLGLVALFLYALRGATEYLVTAGGAASGWRLPAWFNPIRDDDRRRKAGLPIRSGLIFWRDYWHLAQWIRNRAANLAPFLAAYAATSVRQTWYVPIAAYIASEALWAAGHGATFSVLARRYAKTSGTGSG